MSARAIPLVTALVLTLVATPARSEEPAPSTDVRHLELGDRYEVAVRRDDVEQRYSGELVQATDEWIVLRIWSAPHPEPCIPVVSKNPFSSWGDVEERLGRTTYECWIPRSVATVVGRSLVADKTALKRVTSDEPDWTLVQTVDLVEEGKVSQHHGVVRVEGQTLRCQSFAMIEDSEPWPLLGHLPGVGPLFSTSELELVINERQVPLESVLSFQVPVNGGWFPLAPPKRTNFWWPTTRASQALPPTSPLASHRHYFHTGA
jgi:hypothetical protein